MSFVIKHREVNGVYLCHEGLHWYWGPREQAREYSKEDAFVLLKSLSNWGPVLGVGQEDALIEIDKTPDTIPVPSPQALQGLRWDLTGSALPCTLCESG